MSLTIQQILLDSERLAIRLKEDDSAADVLLSQTQNVYKQIDAMKQYAEETGELNELARQRPHSVLVAGIQQESRHLRELQQENRELRAALEEHQNALEVIMSKYRQQVTHLVQVSKLNLTSLYSSQYTQVIRRQAEKMSEMAAVMKMAAEIDEKKTTQDNEVVSRLSTENQGLRELLDISVKFGSLQVKADDGDSINKSKDDGNNSKNVDELNLTVEEMKNDNNDSSDEDDNNDSDDKSNVDSIKFDDKTVIRRKKNKQKNNDNNSNNKISSNNNSSTNNTTIASSSPPNVSSSGSNKLLQNTSTTTTTALVGIMNSSTSVTSPSIAKDTTVKK